MPDSDIPDWDPSLISSLRARDFPAEAVVSIKLRDQIASAWEQEVKGVPGEIRPLDRYLGREAAALREAIFELEARYLTQQKDA